MSTAITGVSQQPIEIFISYSRKDLPFLEDLRRSLKVFENEHGVRIWHDGNLAPGDDWEAELYERFAAAHIILLLVTPNFFNSDYCMKRELPEALKRHENKTARVVPVICQAVNWKYSKLVKLNVLPKNGRPVEMWEHPAEAYENIGDSLFPLFGEIEREIAERQNEAAIQFADADLRPRNAVQSIPSKERGFSTQDETSRLISNERVECAPTADETVVPLNSPPVSEVRQPADMQVNKSPVASRSPTQVNDGSPDLFSGPTSVAERLLVPEILFCTLHPDRYSREKRQRLRKWCFDPKDRLFPGPAATLKECSSLEEVVAQLRQRATGTILLLDGFEPDSPQLEELILPKDVKCQFEVVINSPEWEQFAAHRPSASIMQSGRQVTSEEMLFETLRKVVLKVRTRHVATARVIQTKEEFAAYFELRYKVWEELGYLSSQKVSPDVPWELDFTDRMSLPFGLFSKTDGSLLGAARLVRGFGEEYPQIAKLIEELVKEKSSKLLELNLRYPSNQRQLPFDVLQEFSEFQNYYQKLVKRRVAKAEVSRVIVAPDWQQLGLGEVIVDTLCSFAKAHSFQVLFLACHEKHRGFYHRCGFQVIPGVTGDHFLTYKVPCLAMERELLPTDDLTD